MWLSQDLLIARTKCQKAGLLLWPENVAEQLAGLNFSILGISYFASEHQDMHIYIYTCIKMNVYIMYIYKYHYTVLYYTVYMFLLTNATTRKTAGE